VAQRAGEGEEGQDFMTNRAFSRVKVHDLNTVHYEYLLGNGTRALCNRQSHALAVIEAKKVATNRTEAEAQTKAYAAQLKELCIQLAIARSASEREEASNPVAAAGTV
jgi:hypothetical protein